MNLFTVAQRAPHYCDSPDTTPNFHAILWPGRPLRDIRLGDEIRFKTRERSFEYRVESIEVVAPTDTRVLESSTGHDLTLLTCFPFHYVGPAPKRLVVRAREVEETLWEQLAKENEGARRATGAARWFAGRARSSVDHGELQPCRRWKVAVSASKSEARRRT